MATPVPESTPREPQTLPVDGRRAKKAVISWTGGKDCNLALLAAWRDERFDVSALVVFRPEEAKFKAHPLPLMEAQAVSLGLPLLHVVLPKDCISYKEAYVKGMRDIRDKYRIEVVVTGDMDLMGTMKRNWIEECGEEADLEVFVPLWKANRDERLSTLVEEGFHVVFSCVKSPWFDSSWIGRRIDEQCMQEMKTLVRQETTQDKQKPIDLGGENGEYHTMCLDGPLYENQVKVQFSEPVELMNQRGQKPGERWWTIGLISRSLN